MIPYTQQNFDISDIEFSVVRKWDNSKKTSIEYFNIECGFDIETSSTYYDGEKFAFMYEWTLGIKDKNHVWYGRSWNEFIEVLQTLQEKLNLSENRILTIYVHNLSYEFQFMRKYIEWVNVFAVDDRKPIKALSAYGIEFKDSYILSGYSLQKLAENLVTHKIEKLVGDLDYKKIRHEQTELTELELSYCENDVLIILYYINEQIQQYGNITKIPLTNTGRVRDFVRNKCLHSNKSHRKDNGSCRRYKELMQELTLTIPQYEMLKKCFMGGFTHASMKHVNKIHKDVASIDFTSSYPYVMLSEKFPMSKPIQIDVRKIDFMKLINDENTGLIFECKLNGIHAKNTFETYLSESKCYNVKGGTINNGRIFKADSVITCITDIDFKIIQACYDIESMQINVCYKFYMAYLPKQIIESILELYEKKTTLKGVQGKEVEYLVSKGMLNSVYGMCVTDIIRDTIAYNDEWEIEKCSMDLMQEQIDKNNESKNRFLYYPWGVYVTAYARKNLWNGILNIADDYIYSDTDSIKMLNIEKHKAYIEHYNKQVEIKLKKMCDFMNIDFNRCKPKTIKGVEKLIGIWDFEGVYTRFKTLGSKRYMYEENGKIHITIAGLNKQNGVKYLERIANNDNTKVFELFNDEMYIPPNETGKNTHTYIDTPKQGMITDYTGKTIEVSALTSVHLEECEFTLSIAREYNQFLLMLKQGYIYKGLQFM